MAMVEMGAKYNQENARGLILQNTEVIYGLFKGEFSS